MQPHNTTTLRQRDPRIESIRNLLEEAKASGFQSTQHPICHLLGRIANNIDEILLVQEEAAYSSENPEHDRKCSSLSLDNHAEEDLLVLQRDYHFLCCKHSGRKGDYGQVCAHVEGALNAHTRLLRRFHRHKTNCCVQRRRGDLFLEALILKYKGFALNKLGRTLEAIGPLEQSRCLLLRLMRETDEEEEQDPESTTTATTSNCMSSVMLNGRVTEKRLKKAVASVEHILGECRCILGDSAPLPSIVKYPRTVHLFDTGAATPGDDLVLPDVHAFSSQFCNGERSVIIEEKVDGANLGISQSAQGKFLVQNRNHYISTGDHAQFSRITSWVEEHRAALCDILGGGDRILYGEWVVARHSIPYRRLPDIFVAFDIYDKVSQQFYSRRRFHQALLNSGIAVVPTIEVRTFGPYNNNNKEKEHPFCKEIRRLLKSRSLFRNDGGTLEGVVLRVDEEGWMKARYKVVRSDFIAGCADGHWSSRPIEKQQVDYEFRETYLNHCYVFAQEEDEASSL